MAVNFHNIFRSITLWCFHDRNHDFIDHFFLFLNETIMDRMGCHVVQNMLSTLCHKYFIHYLNCFTTAYPYYADSCI